MKKLFTTLSLSLALACVETFAMPAVQVTTSADLAQVSEKGKPLAEMVLHLRQNAASYKTYAEMKAAVENFTLADGRKFTDAYKEKNTWLLNITCVTPTTRTRQVWKRRIE